MLAPPIFAVGLFAFWISTVYSQATAATCFPEFDWMTNSREQSPCLVASWLYVPCYGPGSPSAVSKIDPGVNYGGPTSMAESTPCDCNTVLYSLRAACGACQDGGALPWAQYTSNCMGTYYKSYPEMIPNGTAVPQWAYLDLIGNSTFNIDAAKALASQNPPDATASGSITSTVSEPTTRTMMVTTIIPSPSTSTTTNTSTQRSNIGAIVGGVIGGVLSLALVVAAILFIIFRRRRHHHHRQQVPRDQVSPSSSETVPIREVSSPEASYQQEKGLGEAGSAIGGFYDPDDPRTYPPALESLNTTGVAPGYMGVPQIMS